jgi:hypothetical protein
MTSKAYTVESVLKALKPAIVVQAALFELARLDIGAGNLTETAKPIVWLGHLPAGERLNFYHWLWAIARPGDDGEERETAITARAGYCLRQIADTLNEPADRNKLG